MDLAPALEHTQFSPSALEAARFPSLATTKTAIESVFAAGALRIHKRSAGFDDRDVAAAIDIVERAEGWVDDGSLKYLVLDFDHASRPVQGPHPRSAPIKGASFAVLLHAYANLVVRVPVISVAVARTRIAGSDLEMALSSNVIFAEEDASFVLPRRGHGDGNVFSFLDSKLGPKFGPGAFDGGVTLTAHQMRELRLVRDVFPVGEVTPGVDKWMAQTVRRHNAAYLVYRAQRVVAPVRWSEVAEIAGT